MALRPGEPSVSERPDALCIADLYVQVESALARAFPRSKELWVRGEIQHLSDQGGRGHCYLDLVDPENARQRQAPVLKVKCWQSTWGPIRLLLAREGIALAPGMVVLLRGTVDFYRPKAEIGFILQELDVTALLGAMAAKRAALIRALTAEKLLDRNRSLVVPQAPVRVGLVASPGTEGYRDFIGQLAGSGIGFQVLVAKTQVQGPSAPRSIASAVTRFSALGPAALDVVVMVRGGGSKGDLAAFDAEPVARAIAACSVPVWTGIGHTGDESVADIVANRACITPTECGRELAVRVRTYWEDRVATPALVVGRRAVEAVEHAEASHNAARRRLLTMAAQQVQRRVEQLETRRGVLARCAPKAVEDARASLQRRGVRLAPLATAHLDRAHDHLRSWRRLAAAYDVTRQLEWGYTLTLDDEGHVVRSAAGLEVGAALTTRFADGTARSVVTAIAPRSAPGQGLEGSNDEQVEER